MSNITNELTVYDMQKWVKNLFQDTDFNIPELEGNYACMNLLSTIISINEEVEKDAEEIIRTESYLTDFYKRESLQLSESFSPMISMNDLQSDVNENIKKIAAVALKMKLKEPTITNFLIGSSDMENKKEFYIEQEMINAFTLSKFSKKITDIMRKNSILEREIEELEKKVSKQELSNSVINCTSKFAILKRDEYQKKIEKINKQLNNCGWQSSLSHSKLVERSEVIQSLEQKVNNLASKLESYQNLPPNEMLTQFKIVEAKEELLRLQSEFERILKIFS